MIYRSKLIELVTPANVTRGDQYNFENDSDLEYCHLVGISAFESRTLSLSPSGATVVPSLAGLTLTLTQYSQKEVQKQIPLSDLNPPGNGGFIRFNYPFDLNWRDSYITVNDPATFNPEEAIILIVYYVPNDQMNEFEELYKQYGW